MHRLTQMDGCRCFLIRLSVYVYEVEQGDEDGPVEFGGYLLNKGVRREGSCSLFHMVYAPLNPPVSEGRRGGRGGRGESERRYDECGTFFHCIQSL